MSKNNGASATLTKEIKDSKDLVDATTEAMGNDLIEYFKDPANPTYEEARRYAKALGIRSLTQWEKDVPSPLPKKLQRHLKKRKEWTDANSFFDRKKRSAGRPKVFAVTADLGNGVSKAGNSLGEIARFESKISTLNSLSQSVNGLFKAKNIEDIVSSDDNTPLTEISDCYYRTGGVSGGLIKFDSELNPFGSFTKIELLPLFLIGVLIRMPKLLAKGDDVNGKRVLNLDLHLTTLADTGAEAIRPNLDKFLDFDYEGNSYQIRINKLFTYREGTGSANIAYNHCKKTYPQARQFVTLDCGGGTLTETYWEVGSKKARLNTQTPYDAGIILLQTFFGKYAKTGDNRKVERKLIESAFQRACYENGRYVAPSNCTFAHFGRKRGINT